MGEDFRAGVVDSLPVQLGVVPFGIVFGVAALDAGLTPVQAVGMSVLVFAGASQLAAVELLGETAPLAVVVGTALVVNLRMLMYSASIAPHFATAGRRLRAVLAYFLVDAAYALSLAEYAREGTRDRARYYLGVGGAIWVAWVAATAVGAVFGAGVPPELELSFAVPLVFVALLVPLLEDRPTAVAGVVGGGVAVAGGGLPANLGLLAGAVAGVAAGLIVGDGDGSVEDGEGTTEDGDAGHGDGERR